MTRRRTGMGVVAVLVGFLVVGAGQAAAQPDVPTALTGTVPAGSHSTVVVGWSYSQGTTPAAAFEVGYHATATTSTKNDFVAVTPAIMTASGGASSRQLVLSDLTGNTRYVLGVRAVAASTEPAATRRSAWVYITDASNVPTTGAAPKPTVVDHRNIMVTPGDKQLMVEWQAPQSAGAASLMITDYDIEYSTTKTFTSATTESFPHVGAATMSTITGLMNDTMYYIRIRSTNDGGTMSDWSSEVMGTPSAAVPTPALPLTGAFALGAGLLAAGRARMRRRRELHAGRDQRQFGR